LPAKRKRPSHIQGHLAAQTHGRQLRCQKSLNFAGTPGKNGKFEMIREK